MVPSTSYNLLSLLIPVLLSLKRHLHLHVISSDLISPSLKTKRHYNTFNPRTEFFLPLADVRAWLDDEHQLAKVCHLCLIFAPPFLSTLFRRWQASHQRNRSCVLKMRLCVFVVVRRRRICPHSRTISKRNLMRCAIARPSLCRRLELDDGRKKQKRKPYILL